MINQHKAPFIATQLTSSWVELCRYKWGFRHYIHSWAARRYIVNRAGQAGRRDHLVTSQLSSTFCCCCCCCCDKSPSECCCPRKWSAADVTAPTWRCVRWILQPTTTNTWRIVLRRAQLSKHCSYTSRFTDRETFISERSASAASAFLHPLTRLIPEVCTVMRTAGIPR